MLSCCCSIKDKKFLRFCVSPQGLIFPHLLIHLSIYRKVPQIMQLSPNVCRNFLPQNCMMGMSLACASASRTYRSLDGSCNNLGDAKRGAAKTNYKRVLPPDYDDGHYILYIIYETKATICHSCSNGRIPFSFFPYHLVTKKIVIIRFGQHEGW